MEKMGKREDNPGVGSWSGQGGAGAYGNTSEGRGGEPGGQVWSRGGHSRP